MEEALLLTRGLVATGGLTGVESGEEVKEKRVLELGT